jgi:hypothetical protein
MIPEQNPPSRFEFYSIFHFTSLASICLSPCRQWGGYVPRSADIFTVERTEKAGRFAGVGYSEVVMGITR